MEDAHTHLLTLPGDKDASFFGVFDGHGGKSIYVCLCVERGWDASVCMAVATICVSVCVCVCVYVCVRPCLDRKWNSLC